MQLLQAGKRKERQAKEVGGKRPRAMNGNRQQVGVNAALSLPEQHPTTLHLYFINGPNQQRLQLAQCQAVGEGSGVEGGHVANLQGQKVECEERHKDMV